MLRKVKFVLVGGVSTVLQLAILYSIVYLFQVESGIGENIANMVSLFIAGQVNFVLSYAFTWGDRKEESEPLSVVLIKLLKFNAANFGGMIVNQLFFLLANLVLPVSIAGLIGIVPLVIVKYLLNDRLVFTKTLVPTKGM